MRLRTLFLAALVGASLLAAVPADAHRSGCHSHHSCPSDHHSYVWYDAAGRGWDCAKPGSPEVAAADTTQIVYDGLPYLCHRAGGAAATAAKPAATSGPSAALVGRTVLLGPRSRTSDCVLSARPDRRCSPGAYYSRLSRAVLCAGGFSTRSIRYVPQAEKDEVEREYGLLPGRYGRTLEIDHVVPLELGGSNAIANLFPEQANAHPGYHVKDRLENRLRALVCSGRMALRVAQRQIAADWTALYQAVYGVAP